MRTCYECGKNIHGEAMMYIPPRFAVALGADFDKAYHPSCYKAMELKASRKLRRCAISDAHDFQCDVTGE